MKIDLYKWQEVKPNEQFQAPRGRLHIMCSEKANLYVSAFGVEILAGFGQEIDVQTLEPVTAIVEASADCRVFVEMPRSVHHVSEGEVFTNIDRTPQESGSVAEVKRAMREWQLEQRGMQQQMRQEMAQLKAARGKSVPGQSEEHDALEDWDDEETPTPEDVGETPEPVKPVKKKVKTDE